MKILVLDSGLDPKSPIAQKTNFKGGLEFYTDNLENIKMNTSALDDTGHGTIRYNKLRKLKEAKK